MVALPWLVLAGAACQPTGTVRAHWTSIDTALGSGDLRLPMHATWCAARGRLTLLGFAGDTGVGLLVRTVKLEPGKFDVSDTVAARSPGAGIAFRLATRTNLFNLSGDSGGVALTSVTDTHVDGRFVGWFRRAEGGPVLLTGSFAQVQVTADTVRCESSMPSPPATPVSADSGVT